MRITLGQVATSTDVAANLNLVAGAVAAAAADAADLLVLPEATMCSFARPRIEAAQPFDGPWATAVRRLATEAGLIVVVGMFTPGSSGRVRNTLLVTGPDVEARYDKVHLFDALGYAESRQIEPGDCAVTFGFGDHRIGLATCYDVRFPGLFTRLASRGAELILLPSSWAPGPDKLHQWRTLVTARAMDSTSFVVAVDQARPAPVEGPQPTGIGHSLVVDPNGRVLLELDEEPATVTVEVDLDEVAQARERLPLLRHAREL
ncbi:MAG TPA: carbon-nitrogen hydrolase family protein [Propionicimonas sp.]|jgi:predicted amidohydrolase|nr:carbon-nitrogen hydrolase family protein [Propionicimonas sp.]